MATKYVRKEADAASGTEARGPYDVAVGRPRFSLRLRLVFLYCGIVAFILLTMVSRISERTGETSFHDPVPGVGLVQEKFNDPDADGAIAYRLRLEVEIEESLQVSGEADVDAAQWERLEAGDQVGVLYAVSRDHKKVRFLQVALDKIVQPGITEK
jgi:hypothetical protein